MNETAFRDIINKVKVVASNRKAYHDFQVEEKYEAGLVLEGSEVKSLREGRASLRDSFARVERGEVYLYNFYIAPYSRSSTYTPDPNRKKKLLLHSSEIRKLIGQVKEKGYSLIPLSVYFKGPYAKIELALAKRKKMYDKRKDIAERTAKREVERALKQRLTGRND